MLKELLLGAAIGFLGITVLGRCGAQPAVSPCQLSALLLLPLDDPDAITVGDAKAVANRLKACAAGDAGQ